MLTEEDFVLGDEEVSQNDFQKRERIAVETAEQVANSVVITEEDKKKAETKNVKKKSNISEEEEILQLTADLSSFIKEKIDIHNDNPNIERFPTGIDILDAIAGGGFGVGTFTMIVGNPGTFKSSLLAQTIAAGQRKFNGRMLATYHDSENSMTQERLSQMGVNRPKLTPYDEVDVESIFQTIEAVSAFKILNKIEDMPSVVAWDSIANTDTRKGIDSEDVDINKTVGLKARILSQLFPRFLPKMKRYNISLIAVNQLREKLDMGMFSAPNDLQYLGNKDIPGGQAVKFNAFHLLHLRNGGDLKYEQYGFNGIKLRAKFIKNKFFRPNVEVILLVDFNRGVSNFWTNYNFLVDNKRIKSGAWNTILGYDEKRFRTKDAPELYDTDPKFKEMFDKAVQETIQTVLLDPNSSSPPSSDSEE